MINFVLPAVIAAGILMWILRPRKGMARSGKLAMIVTIGLSLAVVITAIIAQIIHNAVVKEGVSEIANTCVFISLGLIGVYILIAVGMAIARQFEIARGTGFSACIAVFLLILEFGLLEGLAGV